VTPTKRAMATMTRVAGQEEGNDNGGKSDGNGDKGGGQATATRAMVTRVIGK
jgi:hypothetical protein